ncbi:MAG TPA: phosphoenolpyruvate--protein phosphotransferase [Acidimicrobiia bacterium]|nr:phosphoenolpyruvate--protein phosphotransferase [Acidimicrobiia bacterium]
MGIVVVSHSAKLAEGVVELARQMGGGEVAVVPAGGIDDPDDPIGTDAFRIKEAIEAAWSGDGVLVLMDLGSAIMNAETALEFLEQPADASRVLLCEAPLVEGAVAAVAIAALGASLSEVASEARAGLGPKVQHLGGGGPAPEEAARILEGGDSVRITVPNRLGLHLRPAGRLVETLGRLDATIQIANATTGAGPASARSLSQLSALGIRQGDVMEVTAEGPDAVAALGAVEDLAADNFGDRDDVVPAPTPHHPRAQAAEGTIGGVGASPGLAIGPARHLRRPRLEFSADSESDPQGEIERLDAARAAARRDIEGQRSAARRRAGEDEAGIFTAHLLILDDEDLLISAREQIDAGSSSEAAWSTAMESVAARLRALEDPYQAQRAEDIVAVGAMVLAHLLGVDPRPVMEAPGVLVADELTPGEAATLDRDMVAAIVTAAGAPTSHSAILARALGVPAVVATGPLEISDGTLLLVDGSAGTVVVEPTDEEVALAEVRIRDETEQLEAAREDARAPAATAEGVSIEVAANIGSVEDARAAMLSGADGVGLLRSEFLYMNRPDAPTEAEQEETYRAIITQLEGRPLVLRTIDVGGDKPLGFVEQPDEDNPFLGLRGLRLALARPDLILSQLRAALKVATDHPLRIMFPMVTTLGEWERARALVAEATESIGGLPPGLELGVMVEVPALALMADRFAPVVDFFSIGTNDLTQYTLAAERGNPHVTGLADAFHPAVLRLIDRTCRAAEENGRWVGVCGEMAGDPLAIPLLLGLGVTELSMTPVAIPAAKAVVRKVHRGEARAFAEGVLAMGTAGEVRTAAETFAASLED